MKIPELTLWHTIAIGLTIPRETKDFLKLLDDRGVNTTARYLEEEIHHMVRNRVKTPTNIKLAKVYARDIFDPSDFEPPWQVTLEDLLGVLKHMGANIELPFETGVFLRIECEHSEFRDGVHVAVKPVIVEGFGPCGLHLNEDGINSASVSGSIMPEFCLAVGMPG